MSASLLPTGAIAGWMLYALLISGVVVLAAMAAHDAQRAAQRPVRWVWFGAIVGMVALSAIAPLRRDPSPSRIALTAVEAPTPPVANTRTSWVPVWIMQVRAAVTSPFERVLHTSQQPLQQLPLDVHRLLGVAWAVATGATFAVFLVSYRRSRKRVQHWPIQQVSNTTARISPSIGPAVIGLAPSEIILPSWLLQRPAEEQRLVVAHESEHVRAGDPWLLVVACGAVALMPWNPALWFALGRLRLAIELDCDRRVLRQGIPAASYGALLIDLSALRTALPSAMPAFSCSGSYLERRLVAMTARRSRFSASRRAVGALIAIAAIATACESKLPTSAEIDAMDASTALAKAQDVALVELHGARYVVDDKEVAAATAKAIKAGDIAEVRIVGKSGADAGEIRLRTKNYLTVLDTSDRKLTGVMIGNGAKAEPLMRESTPRVALKASNTKPAFDGLLVINGRVVENSELDRMNPESIASIEVVKGDAARSRYTDARAANGVIVVTTKPKK